MTYPTGTHPTPKLYAVEKTVEKPVIPRVSKRLSAIKSESIIQCECGSRDTIEVTTGATMRDSKVTGGYKRWLCAQCYSGGRRVVLA